MKALISENLKPWAYDICIESDHMSTPPAKLSIMIYGALSMGAWGDSDCVVKGGFTDGSRWAVAPLKLEDRQLAHSYNDLAELIRAVVPKWEYGINILDRSGDCCDAVDAANALNAVYVTTAAHDDILEALAELGCVIFDDPEELAPF